ncbi:MAG: hypothetical protein JWP13_493 [Candidatus Saccharibacteria bacterium]|nr:hypothetical protein [Candidatus Saccharibacteria bacterium]
MPSPTEQNPQQGQEGLHFGWNPVLETERAVYEVHAGRSFAAMGLATVAATALFTGIQKSPAGIDATSHWETTDRTVERTYATSQGTETTYDTERVTRPGIVTETLEPARAGYMPDVPSFDLATTPEAQNVINSAEFDELIAEAQQKLDEGWTITGYRVEGQSSDETRLDENAGIGVSDPQNEQLAEAYGRFIQDAFDQRLAAAGIEVPEGAASFTSYEFTSTKAEMIGWERLKQQYGFATNLDMVTAYKETPEVFAEEDREHLEGDLDFHRGGVVTLSFSKEVEGMVEEATTVATERCVITKTITDTTHSEESSHTFLWPFVPVPVLVPRRRKKEEQVRPDMVVLPEGTESVIVVAASEEDDPNARIYPWPGRPWSKDSPEEVAAQPAVETTPVRTIEDDLRTFGGRVKNGELRFKTWGLQAMKRHLDSESWRREQRGSSALTEPLDALGERLGMGDKDGLRRYVDRELQKRNRTRKRLGAIGLALGIGALSAINLDAGYCPDPENHAEQDFRWNDMPDSMSIRLKVPFTDIQTPQATINLNDCRTPEAGPVPTPGNVPAPTCDTREVYIKDGQVIDTRETHYPGAVTRTTVTP